MTTKISATIPFEERIEFIKRSLTLKTSEAPVEDKANIECKDHEEMIRLLQSLQYRYEFGGEEDRFIVLPM